MSMYERTLRYLPRGIEVMEVRVRWQHHPVGTGACIRTRTYLNSRDGVLLNIFITVP